MLDASSLSFDIQLQQLQVKGEMDAEKAEELAFTLDEKTQSVSLVYYSLTESTCVFTMDSCIWCPYHLLQLTNWNAMMMESKQARVFCVRLIHKLSEVFTGMKVGLVL